MLSIVVIREVSSTIPKGSLREEDFSRSEKSYTAISESLKRSIPLRDLVASAHRMGKISLLARFFAGRLVKTIDPFNNI